MSSRSTRYIHELDQARSAGNWDQVPELIRKLKKHAPERACLALSAEAEHAVTLASNGRPSTARPTTATSSASALSKYIPLLSDIISKETKYAEDAFQARVCLGWVHWSLGDIQATLATLAEDLEPSFAQLDGSNKESANWTKVCALKATYIKGTAQRKTGLTSEAEQTFASSLPIVSFSPSVKSEKELRAWTELYLTGLCMVASKEGNRRASRTLETETLAAFRAWAKFWDSQGASPLGGRVSHSDISRRAVWKEYYTLLSHVLQHDLPFPTTSLTTVYAETSTKLQQRAELKKVESRYENLLLSEVQFPKADESSEEVEEFIDIVVKNWRVLCGSKWTDGELGEGGSEGVSRGVLDILYRAATKTFHSTALLRHLFTVHLAVAEFDVAFKAFETYLEIVNKGKARVEKTGVPEPSLDSDEFVLRTASEYIKALCRYGKDEEAQKAKDIGKFFEDWLEKHHPRKQANGQAEPTTAEAVHIAPEVFALAWRSIGIGYAQWARLTFDGAARPDIQLKAITCFQRSLSPEYKSTTDVETLFALGTLLAERRELASAIKVVKTGLLPKSSLNQSTGLGPYAGKFSRERALIPLWHLLALLLSARQDFIVAAKSCEGAFEQFQDPKNLFGSEELGGFRSEHLNEKAAPKNLGVVDDMDDWEKEGVIEVKMTQLSLIEVLEGPEVAVNASDELLSLYSRLFGDPQTELALHPKPSTSTTLAPPKSSSGTIRSIRGSIFGRTSKSVRKSQMSSLAEEHSPQVSRPHTTQTTNTVAPKIQVINENGATAKQRRHSKDHSHHHETLHKKESVLKKRKSGASIRNRSPSPNRGSSPPRSPTVVDGEKFFTPAMESELRFPNQEFSASQVGLAVSIDNSVSAVNSPNDLSASSQDKPLPPSSQQLQQKEPALQPSDTQDIRVPEPSSSPHSSPPPRFSKEQQMRRRTAILVKVWLLISGFYRRASLFDDARAAIEEASKLVQELAADVSKEYSVALSVEQSGMGGGKTVNQLWGDVFAERGHLALAETAPYSALAHFESALTSFADHPSATVGLSNILLDIYTEDLLPPSSVPKLVVPGTGSSALNTGTTTPNTTRTQTEAYRKLDGPKATSLGLSSTSTKGSAFAQQDIQFDPIPSTSSNTSKKYQHIDRLAARDRAFGLLSNLTKLGSGWNYSEAWFALAKAYELGGQEAKAKDVLWWCVELEEARAVRNWEEVGSGGYVL